MLNATRRAAFWAKVDQAGPGGCWLWTGAVQYNGYGRFQVDRRAGKGVTALVHRVAYELLIGPIPAGLQLDHLCRVRHCVRPSHLEPVTCRENLLRGKGVSARAARATHCPQGHPYEGNNIVLEADGSRKCRSCKNDRLRRAYWRRKGMEGAL